MRFIFTLLLFLIHLNASELLFKSSFEKGVYLTPPERLESTIWWQKIKGSDNLSFSWPIKIQGEEGLFQMIIHDNNISSFIVNRIEEGMGIENKKSSYLHQSIKKKEEEDSQDPYVIYTNDKEQKSLYIRYSLKFPSNLAEHLGKDGWLTFCEYKTVSDYRLAFYIYCDKNKKLYWYVHGDNVVLDDRPYKKFWSREKHSLVPVGQWMDIELYWKRSKGNDGQVWLAVDGKVLINYKGSTKLHEPIHEMMLFTNYSNKPLDQWIDNIEIWSDFPCGEGKSCHN